RRETGARGADVHGARGEAVLLDGAFPGRREGHRVHVRRLWPDPAVRRAPGDSRDLSPRQVTRANRWRGARPNHTPQLSARPPLLSYGVGRPGWQCALKAEVSRARKLRVWPRFWFDQLQLARAWSVAHRQSKLLCAIRNKVR